MNISMKKKKRSFQLYFNGFCIIRKNTIDITCTFWFHKDLDKNQILHEVMQIANFNQPFSLRQFYLTQRFFQNMHKFSVNDHTNKRILPGHPGL